MMHHLRALPIVLSLFVLLPACRPPEDVEAPAGHPSGSTSGDPGSRAREGKADKDKRGPGPREGKDDTRLSRNGLGKEDFALVEAELGCVRDQYKDDETLRGRAEAAVYARYGASEQWVERVRVHLKSEGKYRGKIEDSIALRRSQVCPGGKVNAGILKDLDKLLREEGGEGLLPSSAASKEGAPKAASKKDSPKAASKKDSPKAASKKDSPKAASKKDSPKAASPKDAPPAASPEAGAGK